MAGVRFAGEFRPAPASAFLHDALQAFGAQPPDPKAWICVTVPAGDVEPLRLWSAASGQEAWFWQEPGAETAEAAVGDANAVRGERLDARHVLRTSVHAVHPSMAGPPAPRLVGGMSFDAEGPVDAAWSPFGTTHFMLPRWRLVRRPGQTTLSLMVRRDELDGDGVAKFVREHREVERALASELHAGPAPHVLTVEHLSEEVWNQLVLKARAEIAQARFSKLVTARRTVVRASAPWNPARVLAALCRQQAATTVFAVRSRGLTFLGASPETLVRREGMRVYTEALAGTTRRASDGDARLLASLKDRQEQAIVAREIAARLGSVCSRVRVPPQPRAHHLRDVTHLHTPIEGDLDAPVHVLDLVKLLHPTPAVAGAPSREAMRWIAAHEPVARGWYAGPVGWFDERGDGRFVVAIRSALLRGNEALLYAGAGIVEASDPRAEYEETGWKLRAILSAMEAAAEGGAA